MTPIELTDQWQKLDTEPEFGGTVGGDGAGEAWSVRYGKRNDDGTFAFITSYYYSVDGAARGWGDTTDDDGDPVPQRFSVENMTEFLICTDSDDLGSTEKWSEYKYDDELSLRYLDEADAEREAQAYAAGELAGEFRYNYSWDGVSQ